MPFRPIITAICLSALLFSAAEGAVYPQDQAGDLNRDGRVDIVDVQASLANILGDSPEEGDVNHDGRVDILDFQQLLLVLQTSTSVPPIQDAPVSDAVVPSAPSAVGTGSTLAAILPALLGLHLETPGFTLHRDEIGRPFLGRILLTRAPHAPPLSR